MSEISHRSRRASPDARVFSVIEELSGALRLAGIADPRRVSTDIVAALLEVPRSWPALNQETTLNSALITSARGAARMIGAGAPFAYAVGSSQFRHLYLKVDERVLIPRPETEVLVDVILERMAQQHGATATWGTAIDIGTGSGAIALALASEGRFSRVIATDMSRDALDVAMANAAASANAVRLSVEFRHGSCIAPVRDVRATLLTSNPPYISYEEIAALPASVRDWEPPLALLSANNGMEATATIVQKGASVLVRAGLLALEVDERRASLVTELVMSSGFYRDVSVGLDLSGRERFVFASRI